MPLSWCVLNVVFMVCEWNAEWVWAQPYITSGHTQAPVYAIAERAADLIKQYWA